MLPSRSRSGSWLHQTLNQEISSVHVDPEQAYALFLKKRDLIKDGEFFNDPAHQWLRDLWVAAHYGRGYEQFFEKCTLEFDWERTHEWDFKLHIKDHAHPFQTTEAQKPGRRRGLEYKQIERGERPRTALESWEPGTRHGPEWIRDAIQRKKEKNYAGAEGLNLLIYANFPAYQLKLETVTNTCLELVRNFLSVWVITGSHLGMVHSANASFDGVGQGWLVINQSPKLKSNIIMETDA